MALEIQNPALLPKDVCIFFCWQNHLDNKLHRFLIRDALNASIGKIQSELPDGTDCILRQDSDTFDRAGSVDIANMILQKIQNSTIVVGDVTPVLYDVEKNYFYPNPNVMLELGYAAKSLGWNRIICLFNKAFCQTEILPFDIRHRRITSYHCKNLSQKKQAANELESILYNSLRAVLQEIGRGEFDQSLDDVALKHQRDLLLLRQLMSTIHRGTLDEFIAMGLSCQLNDDCIFFWLGFDAIVSSSYFRFYDKSLEMQVRNFHTGWRDTIDYGSNLFYPGDRPGSFILLPSSSTRHSGDVERLTNAYAALRKTLRDFLDYVHSHYLEIDMNETDKAAWQDNLPYIRENHSEHANKR
jgi:hypothetical protein